MILCYYLLNSAEPAVVELSAHFVPDAVLLPFIIKLLTVVLL